jgi:hypothetical protein
MGGFWNVHIIFGLQSSIMFRCTYVPRRGMPVSVTEFKYCVCSSAGLAGSRGRSVISQGWLSFLHPLLWSHPRKRDVTIFNQVLFHNLGLEDERRRWLAVFAPYVGWCSRRRRNVQTADRANETRGWRFAAFPANPHWFRLQTGSCHGGEGGGGSHSILDEN